MTSLTDFLAYLNGGGVLGLSVLLAWAFYTERLRLGRDFDDLEKENRELRAEVKQLWQEKVADKEEKAAVADAYVQIRRKEGL